MNPGGKGANQAVAIARLEGLVTFICKTGNDIFGHQSQQLFEDEGINTSYIFSDAKNPSGVALITVDEQAENCIVVASGANACLMPSDLAKAEEAIENSDWVLMQLEIPLETVNYVADQAWQKGKNPVLGKTGGGTSDPCSSGRDRKGSAEGTVLYASERSAGGLRHLYKGGIGRRDPCGGAER